jgi:ligand-binding SRPBCC domain-containing protein
MVQRFETRQWLPFPVELVFAFFANPANLPHLMPPRLKTRIEDARLKPPPPRPVAADPVRRFLSVAAGVDSEILISFIPIRWLPKRVSWTARITEFEWNSHFCDEQVRGPFTEFRHRHGIESQARDSQEGTLVTDTIEFSLPWGVAGQMGGLLIQRQLERAFAYRQNRLAEILPAAARQAARRG